MQEAKQELLLLKKQTHSDINQDRVDQLLEAIYEYEEIIIDIENLKCKEDAENIINELKGLHKIFEEFESLANIVATSARAIAEKVDNLRKCNNEFSGRIRVLEEYAPKCTKCDHKLIIREGKGTYFWGCPNFPDCWGKRWLTKEEEIWIYEGIKPVVEVQDIDDETSTLVSGDLSQRDIILMLSQGINPISGEILPDDSFINHHKVLRALYAAVDALETGKQVPVDTEDLSLDDIGKEIFEALREWRKEVSKEKNLSAFIIAENKPLKRVAKEKPVQLNDLQKIKGFGDFRVTEYGEDIIDIVRYFSET